jgi:hypothetical protein
MSDFELTEEQHNEVLHLSRLYYREAHKCKKGKAYLARCVMMGAALEASLLAFVNCYPDEALCSPNVPTKEGKTKPLVKWSLAELLTVAKERGWLPSGLSPNQQWAARNAHIGDYAEALRQTRDLVHPIRYALDLPQKRVTKRYLERSFEIFEVATDYLLNKIGESLRAAFEAEDKEEDVAKNPQPTT